MLLSQYVMLYLQQPLDTVLEKMFHNAASAVENFLQQLLHTPRNARIESFTAVNG